jgi:hypothetical protein
MGGSLLGRVPRVRQALRREARRTQPARIGPRADELGLFATVISRIGPALTPSYERAVRALGEGATVDLAYELARGGEVSLLTAMEPDAAFGYLWPRLHQLVNSPQTF